MLFSMLKILDLKGLLPIKTPMANVRILQETSKSKQFILTLPKDIVQSKGWTKGMKFKILDHDRDSLMLVKIE